MKIIFYNSDRRKHQTSTVHAVRPGGTSLFYTETLCGQSFRNATEVETHDQNRVTCKRCQRSLARNDNA